MRELGVHPFIASVLGAVVFVLLSAYLFFKTEYANWLYLLFAAIAIFRLGEHNRVRLLSVLFPRKAYLKVRLLENLAVALPFVLYLFYAAEHLVALLVGCVAILSVLIQRVALNSRVIPTPFGKTPFENIVGFRKTYILIGVIYFVLIKAIQVGNFNLGVSTLGAVFFLMMSFQAKPEPLHYAWIFSDSAKAFILRKLKYSAICASLLALPTLIALCIFFPERTFVSFGVFTAGQIFLLSMVLAKYSAYPNEMSVPQGLLYALSLWFPPMLAVVCVLFYRKAKRNLKPILE